MSGGRSEPGGAAHEQDRRSLLLHIAAVRPYDAEEISRRTARPHDAVRRDLSALMDAGLVHLHDGSLHVSSADRVVAEASPGQLREIHGQVLAEASSGGAVRPASLVALAETGCRETALLNLLVRAVGDHPEDAAVAGGLAAVARDLGRSDEEVALLRAADAAARGRSEEVLALVEDLLASDAAPLRQRAALLAAGAHMQSGRLDRAAAMHRHVGEERIGVDGGWAALVAVGLGDAAAARGWRAAMGEEGLTSYSSGMADLADGVLESLEGEGEQAVDLLARSLATLAPLPPDGAPLPETPAALAALVAMGRGEPSTAETLLDRALEAGLGGAGGGLRHALLRSWAQMMQGRLDAAERGLEIPGIPAELCDRDRLLLWSLRAGIARRRTEPLEMKAAWREIRGCIVGLRITLLDLLPLGEMMVVAARLRPHIGRDALRVEQLVRGALDLLDRLGNPVVWAAPLHWHGVQAAFATDDPAALIPHANALAAAGRTSRYAATLAAAGRTWLEVLRGDADFSSVEASARALAGSGHAWDASRLAAQAALRHPQRERALSMMQLAREIGRDHDRRASSTSRASVLTKRELEVGRLVLDGQGYRAIGERLFISPKTVEHHVARMRSRLGATSRGELLERLHDIIAEERR